MNRIGDLYNQASSYFMHSVTPTNPTIKRIAGVAFVLIGVVTLGIALNALCRKLNPIDEKDEADGIMGNLFKKIFGGKKEAEADDEDIVLKKTPKESPKKIVEEDDSLSSSDDSDTETDSDTPKKVLTPINNFNFDKDNEMTAEQLLDIQKQLKKNYTGRASLLSFNDSKGINYQAWYNDAFQSINIKAAYSADYFFTTIDEQGQLVAVCNLDGDFLEFTKEKQDLLASLYSALNSPAMPKTPDVSPVKIPSPVKIASPVKIPSPVKINPSDDIDDFPDFDDEDDFSPLKIVKKTPSAVDPLSQFSEADLLTFRSALVKASVSPVNKVIYVKLGLKRFAIWYSHQYSAINIQEENSYNFGRKNDKLGIVIDDSGKISSMRIDDNSQAGNSFTIPDASIPLVKACFKEALKISSEYKINKYPDAWDPAIKITVVRRGLKEVPEFHLEELSKAIDVSIHKEKDPKMNVGFLKDDLGFDPGGDNGGLSRGYLDDLIIGLVQGNSLSFDFMESLLAIPRTKQEPIALQPIAKLDTQELSLYQKLGKVWMYCYLSKGTDAIIVNPDVVVGGDKIYLIGRHFSDAIFKAILCLTANEISTSFEHLSYATKSKMCKAILSAHIEDGLELDFLQKRFDWVDQFDHLKDDAILEIAQELAYSGDLPDDWTIDNKGAVPDLEKVKKNRVNLKELLINTILLQKSAHGQFGAQLAAIHAIAQGMKSICHPGPGNWHNDDHHWNTKMLNANYIDFSEKVQGSLDREQIASQLKLDPSISGATRIEIEKKVGWLKNWIINDATEEDLKNFAKYCTDSSSIAKDKIIAVVAQSTPYIPLPRVHTCDVQLDFAPQPSTYGPNYNDHTEKDFIKCFVELALSDPSAYQMG